MSRATPALLATLLISGCHTPQEWSGGLAPSGAGLSNDQRMDAHGRFVISRLGSDRVWIRRGTEEVPYSLTSFLPVARALDPQVEARIAAAHHYELLAAPFFIVGALAAGYAADDKLDRRRRYVAVGLVALGFLGQRFFDWQMDAARDQALTGYRDALDKRLFP